MEEICKRLLHFRNMSMSDHFSYRLKRETTFSQQALTWHITAKYFLIVKQIPQSMP